MWIRADCRHLGVRPLPLTRDDPPVVHTNCPNPIFTKDTFPSSSSSWMSRNVVKKNEANVLFVRYEQAKVDTFIAETGWHFHLGLKYDPDSQVVIMI